MNSFASFLPAAERTGSPQVALPAKSIETIAGVTFFLVEVIPVGGSVPWAVPRRYSDFRKLRRCLGLGENSLPWAPFPPKLVLECTGERMEARRSGLERWLRELLNAPLGLHARVAQPLRRFLVDTGSMPPDGLQAAVSLFPPPETPCLKDRDGTDTPSVCSGDMAESTVGHEQVDGRPPGRLKRRLSNLRERLWTAPDVQRHETSSSWVGSHNPPESHNSASWHSQLLTWPPSPTSATSMTHSRNSFAPSAGFQVQRALVLGGSFAECARLISRDIPRTFSGNPKVDCIRLRIAEVLRSYAQKDPELGYTQGMCFPAAAVCLRDDGPEATTSFESLMGHLRGLWLPGFPLVLEGTALFQGLLQEHDPEVLHHFIQIGIDLEMVLPKPWLTLFARWLPLPSFLEAMPFLAQEGFPGVLAITLMLLLYHRWFLLGCENFEEVLVYLNGLPTKPPPERLIDMCTVALPGLRARTV